MAIKDFLSVVICFSFSKTFAGCALSMDGGVRI